MLHLLLIFFGSPISCFIKNLLKEKLCQRQTCLTAAANTVLKNCKRTEISGSRSQSSKFVSLAKVREIFVWDIRVLTTSVSKSWPQNEHSSGDSFTSQVWQIHRQAEHWNVFSSYIKNKYVSLTSSDFLQGRVIFFQCTESQLFLIFKEMWKIQTFQRYNSVRKFSQTYLWKVS